MTTDSTDLAREPISHDEAKEIALRLIKGSFRRDGERLEDGPRFSIPCRPDRDDDCRILEYIKQQAALRSARPGSVESHPDDLAVDRFAAAMKEKMRFAREEKGRGGWDDKEQCSRDYLSQLLIEHVTKGDPVDVANLAMMLHQRGETIAAPSHPAGRTEGWQPIETAPKDGTWILLGNSNMVGAGRWMRFGSRPDQQGFAYEGKPPKGPLTHWMPIPASPTTPAPAPPSPEKDAASKGEGR